MICLISWSLANFKILVIMQLSPCRLFYNYFIMTVFLSIFFSSVPLLFTTSCWILLCFYYTLQYNPFFKASLKYKNESGSFFSFCTIGDTEQVTHRLGELLNKQISPTYLVGYRKLSKQDLYSFFLKEEIPCTSIQMCVREDH